MNDKLGDGGPAFPMHPQAYTAGSALGGIGHVRGMSLRDWYAGMAITSWLPTFAENGTCDAVAVARESYVLADAMLAERTKEPKP